jgi:hypothetical protein
VRSLLQLAERVFDGTRGRWQSVRLQRSLGTAIALAFVAAVVTIELARWELVPLAGSRIPTNHFAAVYLAFTLLLVLEVLWLVFSLAESVSSALGKQFEILSLILLRKAFLEFAELLDPADWEAVSEAILHMLSDTIGALAIFVTIGLYYRAQKHQPITHGKDEQSSFVATKKLVALLVLAAFLVLAVLHAWRWFEGIDAGGFFEAFYVILIFSDILIVLVSLRYSAQYHVVFRNSGFAAATVMIRLALTAPPYLNALLGFGSALFALGLSHAYNVFARSVDERGRNMPAGG